MDGRGTDFVRSVDRAAGLTAELLGAAAKDDGPASLMNGEDENRKEGAVDDELDVEDPAPKSVCTDADSDGWRDLPSPCAQVLNDPSEDLGSRCCTSKVKQDIQSNGKTTLLVRLPDIRDDTGNGIGQQSSAASGEESCYNQGGEVLRHSLRHDEEKENSISDQVSPPDSNVFHER